MSPGHAAKRGKRYRYYHSRTDDLNAQLHPVWRVSAPDIESSVITAVIDMLHEAVGSCVHANASAAQIERVRAIVSAAVTRLQSGSGREQRQLVAELMYNVEVYQDRLIVGGCPETLDPTLKSNAVSRTIGVDSVRAGKQLNLIIPPASTDNSASPNPALIKLVTQAVAARDVLGIAAQTILRRWPTLSVMAVSMLLTCCESAISRQILS